MTLAKISEPQTRRSTATPAAAQANNSAGRARKHRAKGNRKGKSTNKPKATIHETKRETIKYVFSPSKGKSIKG